jgi:5'-nucleotidase
MTEQSSIFNLEVMLETSPEIVVHESEDLQRKITEMHGSEIPPAAILDFDANLTSFPGRSLNCFKDPRFQEIQVHMLKKFGHYEIQMETHPNAKTMVEWWYKLTAKALRRYGFNSPKEAQASASNIELKDGALEALRLLDERNIPTLIFSAGLGDPIIYHLRSHGLEPPVASNFMFDSYGPQAIYHHTGEFGLRIYSSTKTMEHFINPETNELDQRLEDFFRPTQWQIVIGDGLHDIKMPHGAPNFDPEKTINIATLPEDKRNYAEKYFEAGYDVIVFGDSFEPVTKLLEHILPAAA